MKELCQIVIYHKKDTNDFEATLNYLGKFASFNPLYFLPDICANNGKLIFSNYDFSDTISLMDINNFNEEERQQYQAVLTGIDFLIKCSYQKHLEITPEIIEILRPYYDITFKFNPIAKITDNSSTTFPIIHYTSFSINEVIQDKRLLYYEYFYQCYSPSDILFSIMHFIALNKYKFKPCMHCGRYFATDNFKNLYCKRFSEYPEYQKFDCYEAVKRIRQKIQRNHRQISNNLRKNYMPENLDNFEMKFYQLLDELKDHSDYETINKCLNFLSKENWYTKDSIRCVGQKEKK